MNDTKKIAALLHQIISTMEAMDRDGKIREDTLALIHDNVWLLLEKN